MAELAGFSQQTGDNFVQLILLYSLVYCHEVSLIPVLRFSASIIAVPIFISTEQPAT